MLEERDPHPIPELLWRPVPQRTVTPLAVLPLPPKLSLHLRVQDPMEQLLV